MTALSHTKPQQTNDLPNRALEGGETVVLVHRSEQIGAAIRHGLEHHRMAVVAVAHDVQQAITLVGRHQPAICLLDSDLSRGGYTVQQIRAATPNVRVAVLGSAWTERDVMFAVQSGADGCLLKSTAPDRMSSALRAMLRGEPALPRAFTETLLSDLRRSSGSSIGRWMSRTTRYPFRFVVHFRRRRRMSMTLPEAWGSSVQRMQQYR